MKIRSAILLICVLILITSCMSATQRHKEPAAADPTPLYEYRVGLGYGFLGKMVQVTIDGREVISVVSTDEIEQYAQLLGTKVLASGSSPKKDITVLVTIDGGEPFEQTIDLSTGMFVHVYLEQTGLRVYNTPFLVQE
ncbi:MAG: hypothetical protein MUO67_13205 [Anaerolineales bacterium]|jgi:hypothetical protein|nr:hypothetical protein [Anaerolineales bacterium]